MSGLGCKLENGDSGIGDGEHSILDPLLVIIEKGLYQQFHSLNILHENSR